MSISLPSSSIALSAAVTRILAISGFPPELKTRDIHSAFAQWENDKGGFKIKWIDDTSALIVFTDATVAKRAYLQTLLSPPPVLSSPTSTLSVQIRPYDGPDAQSIITNVNSRTTNPPPRSNSGGNGNGGGNSNPAHNSRASFSIPNGAPGGPGHIRAASMVAAIPSVGGHTLANSASMSNLPGSGTAASRWAPTTKGASGPPQPAALNVAAAPAVPSTTTGSGTSPTLPSLPYQPTLNSLISSSLNGGALSTSPHVEGDTASSSAAAATGPPRIGDPGRRMVAGALGVRHPSLRRASPPSAGGVAAEVSV